jgi:phosphoglycolate phosphatase
MTLLFDLDGTLIDVRAKYYRVYCLFLDAYRVDPLQVGIFWEMKRAGETYQKILQASRLGFIDNSVLHDFVRENIEKEDVLLLDQLFDGAEEILAALSKEHDCYLISMRRDQEMFRRQVGWLGITKYFKQVINASPLGRPEQSDLTAKSRALKALGLSPRLLIVGDSGMDIMTGKQLGATTCAVTTGLRNENVLRRYDPDFIVGSIAELDEVLVGLGV